MRLTRRRFLGSSLAAFVGILLRPVLARAKPPRGGTDVYSDTYSDTY
jgi:hypothetical protein